jgi:hypothetical protein
MNIKTRILPALLLAAVLLPFSVYAYTYGDYTYTVYDGKATITDFNSSYSGSLTIPSTLGGYPVTSISYRAFYNCYRLTSVTIPDSATRIGDEAFSSCTSLTAINVSKNNPAYTSTNGVLFNKNLTTLIQCPGGFSGSYTIPDSVTSIGNNAFRSCTSLTAINVSENNPAYTSANGILFNKSLTALIQCPGSFSGSYTIPDSVTSIGDSAFYDCTKLTSVNIPDSVKSVGDWAFGWCASLASVTIGNSVTDIGGYAFCYCSSLASVVIGNNVIAIGDRAFYNCDSLTSVNIPDSVTNIGGWAFGNCYRLTSVTIPDSVTTIGYWAFRSCTNITSVTIGNSVTNIGDYAFGDCSALQCAYFKGNAPSRGYDVFLRSTQTTVYRLPYAIGWPTVPNSWCGRPTAYWTWPVTVMFDPLGGAVDPSNATMSYGFAYGVLPVPMLAGHFFGGWWTEAGGTGTQVTDTTLVTTASDHTLYAKWINPYAVGNGENAVPVGKVTAACPSSLAGSVCWTTATWRGSNGA